MILYLLCSSEVSKSSESSESSRYTGRPRLARHADLKLAGIHPTPPALESSSTSDPAQDGQPPTATTVIRILTSTSCYPRQIHLLPSLSLLKHSQLLLPGVVPRSPAARVPVPAATIFSTRLSILLARGVFEYIYNDQATGDQEDKGSAGQQDQNARHELGYQDIAKRSGYRIKGNILLLHLRTSDTVFDIDWTLLNSTSYQIRLPHSTAISTATLAVRKPYRYTSLSITCTARRLFGHRNQLAA